MEDNEIFGNMPSTSVFALAQQRSEPVESMAFDANCIDAASNEQPSPEFLQRKLYFLLEHLKKMHSELPE